MSNAFPPLRAAPRCPCALAIAACFVAIGVPAAAQTPGFQQNRLWVDDDTGDDSLNNGTEGSPFRTITRAIAAAVGGQSITVIMVKPGVYDDDPSAPGPAGQREVFPLAMKRNVSLQGAGALDTVIRSVDADVANPNEVLIRFRASVVNAFEHSYIDGFNIHNQDSFGETQTGILFENIAGGFPPNPTISNCFLTDHNEVAIDIVSAPDGDTDHDLDEPGFAGYIPHQPRILFCTFRDNTIGVRNRTSIPVNGFIWGTNQPGFLNCLFVDQSTDDLQGIDDNDLLLTGVNTRSIIFEKPDSSGILLWPASAPPPMSKFPNLNGAKAAGLFVDSVTGTNNDLRLNPGLKLIVTSTPTPIDAGLNPGSAWTWRNGTSASRAELTGFSGDAFDWDCEGYGNPRFVDYLLIGTGAIPDIGADEIGYLVIGGFDGQPFRKDFATGTTNMHYWFQFQGLAPSPTNLYTVTEGHTEYANLLDPLLYTLYLVSTKIPSMRPRGTTVPTLLGPPYIGPGFLQTPPALQTFQFNAFPMIISPNPPWSATGLHNEQAALHDIPPGSGNYTMSNLQTYRH